MSSTIAQITIIDRSVFDNPSTEIQTDGIYFVREGTSETAKMLSLYVGRTKQCDLIDITGIDVDFTDPNHLYNIPISYRIPNKIILCKDNVSDFYHALMWNEGEEEGTGRFYDVGSIPLTPDEVTILTSAGNIISGVGANVGGKTFTINGSSVVARDGAEIFNYISGSATNNIATGLSSHVEGSGNTENGQGEVNHIEGKNNSITSNGNKVIHIEGYNNTMSGSSNQNIHIEGSGNTFSGAGNSNYSVRGSNNTISASGTANIIVDGSSNSVINGGGSELIITGQNNSVATDGFYQSEISGYGNKILPSASGNLVYIYGYGNEVGSSNDAANVNGLNITGRTNKFVKGSCVGLSITGDSNTVSGNIMGSSVFGMSNSFSTKGDPAGMLLGGYNNTTDSDSLIRNGATIFGANNTFTSGQLDASLVCGNDDSISGTVSNGSAIFGAHNSITSTVGFSVVSGESNTINNLQAGIVGGWGNTISALNSIIVGYGLATPSNSISNTAIFGTYNYLETVNKSLCVGNGASESARSNALVVDTSGNLVASGNIISGTGASLSTVRVVDTSVQANNSSYIFAILPRNGSEIILSDTYTIDDITITDIDTMPKADVDNYLSGNSATTQARTDDYTSVIIFKKSSNLTNISNAITNFNANDSTKIYLLNPDLDISNYTIIHIMLSYDGFNMTAIAAGYEEVSNA